MTIDYWKESDEKKRLVQRIQNLGSDKNLSRLDVAIKFATETHSGQKRKCSPVPYIIHPLNVLKILVDIGCNEEIQIAGILHDTVEDTKTKLEDISNVFGTFVSEIVFELSEDKTKIWEERKQATIDKLKKSKIEVIQVKYADVFDNLRSLKTDLIFYGEDIWNKFKRGRLEQKWYNEEVINCFHKRISDHLYQIIKEEFDAVFKTHKEEFNG
jgi:(p)ppGpp synthase/HD superfamily hydrolase